MSNAYFLVDYENKCQDFREKMPQTIELDGRYRFDVKIYYFVAKSTVVSDTNVEIKRAHTDSKEAADTTLYLFCAGELNELMSKNNYYGSNSNRVYLVHGGDEGYGELSARMTAAYSDKFNELILDESSKLTNYFPQLSCVFCDKVFPTEYQKRIHCNCNPSKCNACNLAYHCLAHLEKEISKQIHQNCRFKDCNAVGCDFSFFRCTTINQKEHNRTHRLCSCCNKHFISEVLLASHNSEKARENVKLKAEQEYKENQKKRLELDNLMVSCPNCQCRVLPKNLRKHIKQKHTIK